MFARHFMIFAAAATLLSACSTSQDTSELMAPEREAMTGEVQEQDYITSSIPAVEPGSQAELNAMVGDRVFFGYDRYDLSAEARDILAAQATWLQQYPSLYITVEGHADERGTREYNLALGERRANSAKNYLIALGVNPARINVISYGKERPAVPGSNEAAWAQNRRAAVVVE